MSIISTPDLCDKYGDAVQVCKPVFSHYGAVKQFAGEIVTVKCFEDNSMVAEQVRMPGKGKVLVVDGGGSSQRSLLGDNLAGAAIENGWAGIVIYGYLRDVEDIALMPIGVMAMGAIPRKTQKLGQGEVNIPITIAGVSMRPAHYLYADCSGVVVAANMLPESG